MRRVPYPLCLSAWPAAGLVVLPGAAAPDRAQGRSKTQQQLLVADRQTLIDSIVRQYEAVHDFNATVDMVPALGTAEKSKITEYKDVRAFILFRKPADIRLIGLYPVVRNKAFDMVSNGDRLQALRALARTAS